jgi:starvation-inducible DNA-binding protein
MDADQRKEVAEGAANILADAYRLLINTQGLHWKLTEDHYRELFESIDSLAERIRALGLPAPQSFKDFSDRSALADMPDNAELEGRIERLIEDYERAARRVAQVVELAENNKDIKTSDLLTERIGVYEENAWMLRATIA